MGAALGCGAAPRVGPPPLRRADSQGVAFVANSVPHRSHVVAMLDAVQGAFVVVDARGSLLAARGRLPKAAREGETLAALLDRTEPIPPGNAAVLGALGHGDETLAALDAVCKGEGVAVHLRLDRAQRRFSRVRMTMSLCDGGVGYLHLAPEPAPTRSVGTAIDLPRQTVHTVADVGVPPGPFDPDRGPRGRWGRRSVDDLWARP